MAMKRTDRLNSLLKEVISDIIRLRVRNPHVSDKLLTITSVDITKDLKYAKVYVSVIGTEEEKQQTINALQTSAGFIGVQAAKQVVMRFFPSLTFKLDDSADKQMRIDTILTQIQEERHVRSNNGTTD